MTVRKPAILLASLAAIICSFTSPATGEQIRIVLPPGFEDVEGDTAADSGTFSFRQQEIISSSHFQALPEGGAWLLGFADRADASTNGPVTLTWSDMKIEVWTSQRESLSPVFAENTGADAVTVLDGRVDLRYEINDEGPNPFSGFWKFEKPFFYDPDKGNLIFDYVSYSGSNRLFYWDAQHGPSGPGIRSMAAAGDVGAPRAQFFFSDSIVAEYLFDTVGPLLGDYDGGGSVGSDDFNAWKSAFGSRVRPAGSGADGNGNGLVDAADYVLWRKSLGQTAGSGAAVNASAAVPEPATLVQMVLVVAITSLWRRRGVLPRAG
jgi:hypothetical protein